MRKFKRMIVVVVIFALLLPNYSLVHAAEWFESLSTHVRANIIGELQIIEQEKELWELETVEFSKLRIGEPIQAYNYVDKRLEASWKYYPIIFEDKIVLLMIETDYGFLASSGLVSELNKLIDLETAFSLVYDSHGVYLFDQNKLEMLLPYESADTSRDTLHSHSDLCIDEVSTVRIGDNVSLDYNSMSAGTRSTNNNYICYVDFVTQYPQFYSGLCWAATIACISNYVEGTDYTATDIASTYYGSTSAQYYNMGLGWAHVQSAMRRFGLNYAACSEHMDVSNQALYIQQSLMLYLPVYGHFRRTYTDENGVWTEVFHAATICGWYPSTSRFRIMDSNHRVDTAILSGDTCYFVCSATGHTYYLKASCWPESVNAFFDE